MKNKFPKLTQLIKNPKTRFVIALDGGGIKSCAHATALNIVEQIVNKKDIHEIWGCSGGAAIALAYSCGVTPQQIDKTAYNYYKGILDLHLQVKLSHLIDSLILRPTKRVSTLRIPYFEGFISDTKAFKKLFSTFNISDRKLSIPFFATAANASTNKVEILTPNLRTTNFGKTKVRHCNAFDALAASCSIPLIFVPYKIRFGKNTQSYFDGGAEANLLPSIYNKWVHDKAFKKTSKKNIFILVVNLFPKFSRIRKPNYLIKIIYERLNKYISAFELFGVFHKPLCYCYRMNYNQKIKHMLSDKSVIIAELYLPFSNLNFLDRRLVPKVIKTARDTFYKQLKKIESRF